MMKCTVLSRKCPGDGCFNQSTVQGLIPHMYPCTAQYYSTFKLEEKWWKTEDISAVGDLLETEELRLNNLTEERRRKKFKGRPSDVQGK